MKKIVLLAMILVGTTGFAQERKHRPEKGGMEQMSPEERDEMRLKRLTKDLNLDTKQQDQVRQLMIEQGKKRAAMMDERAKIMEAKKAERKAMRDQMQAERDAADQQLKTILNADQWAKFEKIKAERKDKREAFKAEKQDRGYEKKEAMMEK